MQTTSETYQRLLSSTNYRYEVTLVIGESGSLIDQSGDYITFADSGGGSFRLLVDTGEADSGFNESQLISLKITQSLFSEDVPMCGCAIASELDVEMIMPISSIPRKARVVPYVRLTDGTETSEWLQQGVFFIDTREVTHNPYGDEVLSFHAYDASWTLKSGKQSGYAAIITKLKEIETKLDDHITEDQLGYVKQARTRILRFNDEVLQGSKHTSEHWTEALEDIDIYENYCKSHPEFPNNKAVLAIENLKRVYQNCLQKNNFL